MYRPFFALVDNLIFPVAYKCKAALTAADPGGNYTIAGFTNPFLYKYVEIVTCPDVYVSGNNVDNTVVKVSSVTDAGDISYWLNDNSGGITSVGANSTHYNVKYEEKTRTLTLLPECRHRHRLRQRPLSAAKSGHQSGSFRSNPAFYHRISKIEP